MMIIDIRQLNAKKAYSGAMRFEYSAPEDLIGIPFVKFSAHVVVAFDYELFADDSLEIRGTVTYRLEGKCSRCLKEADTVVEGELVALFEPTKDCEDYAYTGSRVNLTDAVDDAIMASMPFALSCGEECQGIGYTNETEQSEE